MQKGKAMIGDKVDGAPPSKEKAHSVKQENSDEADKKCDDSHSVGGSPEPRPKRTNASPLSGGESGSRKRRRSPTRWTTEEVDALKKGVAEHGQSNWMHILHSYRSVFNEVRTGGDLKDKWRNLMK